MTLVLEPFASGLAPLTYLTHAADGSGLLYAVEQEGVIQVIEADGSVRPEPFLDISERVAGGGERGLLGLAFHPQHVDNGRLFVNYTDVDGHTVVAEYARPTETTADPASERILLRIEQPFANHNGGMIEFGADGYLYVATGDGGGGGDPHRTGQDLGSLLGAMLRIDVDVQRAEPYGVPPDNPFVGQPGARPEIWAWGLRNPWRFSFDRRTGALFIGDVGQGAWEEINAQTAGDGGQNFGWNIMEGPQCFAAADCDTSGLTVPVAAYRRDSGNCAVTGGYVYRGERFPALAGAYLLADYCSGVVWGLDAATAVERGEAELHELASAGLSPSSFGQDEAGELYLVGHDGQVLRISARQP
ncbi:MAG: PQQ-dependent sugar dehydrogenase [Chloroflexota bacterium]|nr:PQQ-dependent sugar dehydrogenase [Chloroflexota bacterium]